MSWSKKLKAYTLSEIIIVLILTSIVVGLALSALQLIHKQMTALKLNNENHLHIKSLETRLTILFNQSEKIQVLNENIQFFNRNDTLKLNLRYNTLLIGNDTIKSKVDNMKTYFKGSEIQKGYIDAMSLEVSLNETISKSIFVSKINDAKIKLKSWE